MRNSHDNFSIVEKEPELTT